MLSLCLVVVVAAAAVAVASASAVDVVAALLMLRCLSVPLFFSNPHPAGRHAT